MGVDARTHTRIHARTLTKIETKSMCPHFGLSPTGANNTRILLQLIPPSCVVDRVGNFTKVLHKMAALYWSQFGQEFEIC